MQRAERLLMSKRDITSRFIRGVFEMKIELTREDITIIEYAINNSKWPNSISKNKASVVMNKIVRQENNHANNNNG